MPGCERTGPWSAEVTAGGGRGGESTAAALAEPASSTAPHGERSSGCLHRHLEGRYEIIHEKSSTDIQS